MPLVQELCGCRLARHSLPAGGETLKTPVGGALRGHRSRDNSGKKHCVRLRPGHVEELFLLPKTTKKF